MTKKNIILSGILAIVSIVGISLGAFLHFSTKEEQSDPLGEYISSGSTTDGLKGDFLTGNIYKYDGPKNEILKQCMQTKLQVEPSKKVTATYNPDAKITQTKDEIIADIVPILGYAAKNKQINWTWDYKAKTYTFHTAQGDEKFWWCYFKNETKFFQTFFKKSSISTDFKRGIEFSFHRDVEQYSTPEYTLRNYFPSGEISRFSTIEIVRVIPNELNDIQWDIFIFRQIGI